MPHKFHLYKIIKVRDDACYQNILQLNWRKYSKDALSSSLSNIEWRLGVEGVQQYWNIFGVMDKVGNLIVFNVVAIGLPRRHF